MIQHKILTQKSYAYIEVRGKPALAEFVKAARLFTKDPDFNPGVHRIADCSQANLSHITVDELMAFIEFAKTHIPLQQNTRCAIVAPDMKRAGIFQAFADHIDAGNFKMFDDPLEAVEWIGNAPAVPAYFDKILGGVA